MHRLQIRTPCARPAAAVPIRRRLVGIPGGARTQSPEGGGQLVVTLKRRLFARVRRQFGHPRGLAGRAAGWVMANWRSNRQRNTWVVSLLGVRPTERVLEVGFGPGLAIAELARRITDGRVYGVDGSEVMLEQATKRNAGAIQAGRVTVTLGTIERLPPAHDGPFDAVLTVNSLGFWTAPGERLECLRRRLTPGGRIAIASGPRCPGATR